MNFKEYKNSEKQTTDGGIDDFPPAARMLLKNFVKDYEGKSREEIIAEIIRIAKKNRQEGKLSDGDLDNFYRMLKPVLNGEQLKTLDEIMTALKQI